MKTAIYNHFVRKMSKDDILMYRVACTLCIGILAGIGTLLVTCSLFPVGTTLWIVSVVAQVLFVTSFTAYYFLRAKGAELWDKQNLTLGDHIKRAHSSGGH